MDMIQINRDKLWEVQNLSFEPVPVEKKLEAVFRALARKKMQAVAREVGAHRISVYIYLEGKGPRCFVGSIRTW